jgi:N-acetylmuramoyl-L-alanine amidase
MEGQAGRSKGSTPRPPARRALIALLLGSAALILSAAELDDAPNSIEIDFDPHGTLQWDRGRQPVLMVWPRRGDGWIVLADRLCGDRSAVRAMRDANPRLSNPMRDRPVRVPLTSLRDDLRLAAVGLFFPVDRRVSDGWEHWILDPFDGGEESWEWLATLFTGTPEHADTLRRVNPELPKHDLERGRPMLIPDQRLLAVFREVEPPRPTPVPTPQAPGEEAPTPPAESTTAPLSYSEDSQGPYAEYRLRRGEALYSAVVVRFTGQLEAKQVNATAMEIAARSGVEDVTSMPVGFPVKIPLDLLLPKYLPPDHPRRKAREAEERELAGFLEVVQATDLSGVHVILDAGHGGADSGAVVGGLWESAYVYDISCRIKRNLEEHTRATVWMIRKDAKTGYAVPEHDRLSHHTKHYLLTRPHYELRDAVLGVHLRWYLTNDIILQRLDPKVPRSKTVFMSLHADSLHPSIRGAMVYVPSRYLRPSTYKVRRKDINRYAEYRNHPTIRLGPEYKARVEASSRHLAENLVASFRRNELVVHSDEPVRDRILRGRRSWVPAVLRYTAAQNAVLVECCNMANAADRQLLVDREWREAFARGVVEGMAAAFNGR